MLIPSIDLCGGRIVKFRRGAELLMTAERDPHDVAEEYGRVGEIAVLDQDADRATGDNSALIEELCAIAACRVGGGIRDADRARRYLEAGARRVMIPVDVAEDVLDGLPRDRVMLTVNVPEVGGEAAVDVPPWLGRLADLAPYASGVLFTFIGRVGTEAGANPARARMLARQAELPSTVAGGIGSVEDILSLDRHGIDAQVGTALLSGTVTVSEGFASLVDFDQGNGRVPTLVQDVADGTVLLVGWSTQETLAAAIERGETVLWSSEYEAGRRGDETGNAQSLVRVEMDCDRDALRFMVAPYHPACRRGTASCFGDRTFSLTTLEQTIAERASSNDETSYVRKLVNDAVVLRGKILEEAHQLVEAKTPEAVRNEGADLLFHLLVSLHAGGLTLHDVVRELDARRRHSRGMASPLGAPEEPPPLPEMVSA